MEKRKDGENGGYMDGFGWRSGHMEDVSMDEEAQR